jgi:hypothetical protein
VAQLCSRRQYTPKAASVYHQDLERRLKFIEKEWQECRARVKVELADTGDHETAQKSFAQLKKLKSYFYDFYEMFENAIADFMSERSAVHDDLEELIKLFSLTREESASRKNVIDAIRSYCDDMGKNDTTPTANPGQMDASVQQVLGIIRSYCDSMGKDDTKLIANPGQTGASEPVRKVLDTIRSYCDSIGKDHKEITAGPGQTGAPEPFSPFSKYRLDTVEKQFEISLHMMNDMTGSTTINEDDSKSTILYDFSVPSSAGS